MSPLSTLSAVVLVGLFFVAGDLGAGGVSIDKRIRLQPIQVCSDDGLMCANGDLVLFAAETARIWAQAGIQVEFLPVTRFFGSNWLDLQTGIFSTYSIYSLAGTPGHGQHPDPSVINVWFVRSFNNGAYGHSLQSSPGVAERNGVGIADNAFSYNGGLGRIDVVAHELGHNLGLDHDTFGPIGNTNLMSASRQIPATLADIFPEGMQLDYLNPLQIAQARSMSFAVPAPRLVISQGSGLLSIGWQEPGFLLETSTNLLGPWEALTNQANPHSFVPSAPAGFYRLRQEPPSPP